MSNASRKDDDGNGAVTASPIGTTAVVARQRRAANNSEFAREWESQTLAREIAWLLIRYRIDHDLTQEQLAQRAGTSHSQIARIESGRHMPSVTSLGKIAAALGLSLRIRFEASDDPARVAAD